MRPFIICHMGTSLDGGLHPSRFTRPAAGVSNDVLRGHYEAIHDRFEAEGWIVGRKTMAEMAKGRERAVAVDSPLAREPHLGNRNGRNLAVAIDPSGRVRSDVSLHAEKRRLRYEWHGDHRPYECSGSGTIDMGVGARRLRWTGCSRLATGRPGASSGLVGHAERER